MKRSKKVVLVPFCLLAQGFRAEGIVKKYPATIEPVLNYLINNQINIIQMPCPEIIYEGIKRKPAGKQKYNTEAYRQLCRKLAKNIVTFIETLTKEEYKVLAILGIEHSPSCAATWLLEKRKRVRGKGIFIEELEKLLTEKNLEIPIIGVDIHHIKTTLRRLEETIPENKHTNREEN